MKLSAMLAVCGILVTGCETAGGSAAGPPATVAGTTFTGRVAGSGSNCFASISTMTVTMSGSTVTGDWGNGRATFRGQARDGSFSTVTTTANGEPVTVRGAVSADGATMEAGFSGTRGCSFSGTLSKRV